MSQGSWFFNRARSTYLQFSGNSAFSITTSTTPFTIECWVFPLAADGRFLSEQYTGVGDTISIVCGFNDGGINPDTNGRFVCFAWYNGSAWVAAAVSTVQVDLLAWTHLAFVFTGSTTKIYIGGLDRTRTATPTPATTWGVTGDAGDLWYIGRRWDLAAGGTYYSGYISDLRFVRGTAVYTANFTPSTDALTSIENTSILTCNTGEITPTDSSSNNFTITNVNGVLPSNRLPWRGNVYVGEAVVSSEEYSAELNEFNIKGRWSAINVGPNYR